MKRLALLTGVFTVLLTTPAAALRAAWPWEGQRIHVDSGVFDAAGYHREKQELTLWFDNGAVYVYREVPAATFDLFLAAEAKGEFFHRHIRGRFASDCRQTATRRRAAEPSAPAVVSPGPVQPAGECTRLAQGGAR